MRMMRPSGNRPWCWLPLIALVLPSPLGGCASRFPLVDNASRITPGAIPPPIGTYTVNYQRSQTEKAEADDFVFYRCEFTQGGNELGPAGTRHLTDLIPRLPDSRCPIVIEPDLEVAATNEARRDSMIARLAAFGVPDPDSRVIIAYPQAEKLYGDQAPFIYGQIVSPRSGAGVGSGAGGLGGQNGASGGFGGSGFGGVGGLGGFGGYSGVGGGLPF